MRDAFLEEVGTELCLKERLRFGKAEWRVKDEKSEGEKGKGRKQENSRKRMKRLE